MSRTQPLRRILLLTALLAGLGAPAAHADLTWTAQQTLSTGQSNASAPAVGVDASGGAVAAWLETEGGANRVHVGARSARGFFGDLRAISPADRNASEPKIAVARDGTAVVAWSQPQAVGSAVHQVVASVRPPGGSWTAPERLSGDVQAGLIDMEMDRAGNLLLLITRQNTASTGSVVRVRRPAGGSFSGFTTLWSGGQAGSSVYRVSFGGGDIAFDAAGNALMTYSVNPSAYNQDSFIAEVHAAGLNANGTAVADQLLAQRGTDTRLEDPSALITPQRSIVTWTRNISAGDVRAEHAYRAGLGGGAFSAPQRGFGNGDRNAWTTVATDPSGNGITTVQRQSGTTVTYREAVFEAAKLDFNGAQPLPAGIPTTPSGFDDSRRGALAFVGDDKLRFAQREPGLLPVYSTPVDLGATDGDPSLGVGPDGTAVAAHVVNDGENLRVVMRAGDLPLPATDPGTPAAPAPVVTPPPPPEPPVPSAITLARKLEPGKPAVLTVAVSGAATRVEWSVDGASATGTVVGGVLQRSVRARLDGAASVGVTVSGPGGRQRFTRALAGQRKPADAAAKAVFEREPSGASKVAAAGFEDALLGKRSACSPMSVSSGALTLTGCMRPIDGLGDIPAGERGVLDPIASAYKLDRGDAGVVARATELLDGYVIEGVGTFGGLWRVSPARGASLVAFPQASALTSSNASIRVAGQDIKPGGSGFNLKLGSAAGFVDLGTLPRLPGLPRLGGFPWVGDVAIQLGPAYAQMQTRIKMPDFVQRNGVNVVPRVQLYAYPDSIATAQAPPLGKMDVSFGPVTLDDLLVRYDPATDQWVGGMSACLFGPGCVDFRPPAGGIRLQGNELVFARSQVDLGDPGQALGGGLFLQRLGAGFGLSPSRVFGSARLSFGNVVKLDGNQVFAFPSAAAPYTLRRDEAGNAFPTSFYTTKYTRPLVAAGADLLVDLPVIGETKLGGGYALVEFPGYVALGGNSSLNVLDVLRLSGGINGEASAETNRANLHGDIRACLIAVDDDLCATAVTNVSRGPSNEGGAGGCLDVGPVSAGGGVQWARPSRPFIWPIDGCKWSTFKLDVRARSAQAGAPMTVQVGDQARAIQLDGATQSPNVKVTGPGGQTLELGDKRYAFSEDGDVRILRFDTDAAHFVTVGLQGKGRWQIEPVAGSAPITQTSQAVDPPAAKASAGVTGEGDKRVLTFDVRKRDGQVVTFYDVTAGGARKAIGTTKGGRGQIPFTPAPDRGRHTVVASFAMNDLGSEERKVAAFRPPSPVLAAPKRVRARRKGTTVTVRWARVPGAKRYELALGGARQRFVSTTGRRATFKQVAKTQSAAITVRATATLRESPVSRVRVKRAAKPRRALGGLKRCTIKRKRVRCR